MRTRKQTLTVLSAYLDAFQNQCTSDRPDRRPVLDDHRLVLALGHTAHVAARDYVRLVSTAFQKWLEVEDEFRLVHFGTRAMLALEIYKTDHDGYPAALEALVPKYLPAIEPDPVSGQALRYKVLAPGIDPHGRGYLFYSVGNDRTDNAARTPEHFDRGALSTTTAGRGFDFVLNTPAAPRTK